MAMVPRTRIVPVPVDASGSSASSGSPSLPSSSSASAPASSSSGSIPLAASAIPAPGPGVVAVAPKAKAMPKGKAKAKARPHGPTVMQLRGQHMGPLKTINKTGKVVQLAMYAPIGRLKPSFMEAFEKVVEHWKEYRLAQRLRRGVNGFPRHTATPGTKIEFDQCLGSITVF